MMNSQHSQSMASGQNRPDEMISRQINSASQSLISLYMFNFTLIFTHEIDSAYWEEWNLFGIPGGIQVFLVLNFLLLLAALLGFGRLLLGKRDGYVFSLLIGAGGLFAFGIHGYFLLAGRPEFRLPLSLAILAVILLVSVLQIWKTLQEMRQHR